MDKLDDKDLIINLYALCRKCQYFNYDKLSCRAFPEDESIPDEILSMNFKHTVRHPDQKNDVVFKQIEGELTPEKLHFYRKIN